MKKDAALNIRIKPELKAALEALAAADGRTVSGFVQKALTDLCVNAGALKQPSKDEPK
jgi:uncharacterized protein (DUF1778 family)